MFCDIEGFEVVLLDPLVYFLKVFFIPVFLMSFATLTAVLTMREKSLGWTGNKTGLSNRSRLRIYASEEVHSSIDRAIWFSGIGEDNLVRIPVYGDLRSMDTDELRKAIQRDKEKGYAPAGVIAATGGTSTGSVSYTHLRAHETDS